MGELASRLSDDASKDELRSALRSALRKLDRRERDHTEYLETLREAGRVAAAALDIGPVPAPRADRRHAKDREPEVAIILLSDWQLGKRTPTYDSDVCERRIQQLAGKIESIVRIQREDHPVRELRMFLLGDMVEGEMIFPGQAHLIDASLYRQAMVDGPRILTEFTRRMAGTFERVHATCVDGNHGRIGRRGDFHPESNSDRFLYRFVGDILAASGEKRVTWDIPGDGRPGEANWYAMTDIGAYRAMLTHGYQFRGTAGMPWYGIAKKAGGWALGAIEEWLTGQGPVGLFFGHWHQPTKLTLNRTIAYCNGST
jgi:hypothetical protein